jgi:hypothetical protein
MAEAGVEKSHPPDSLADGILDANWFHQQMNLIEKEPITGPLLCPHLQGPTEQAVGAECNVLL